MPRPFGGRHRCASRGKSRRDTEGIHGHGQVRTHITGDGGFRHSKVARQTGFDAVPEALTPEVLDDLLAVQTNVKAANTVLFAPSICTLSDFCPTCWGIPDVWHLS